MIAAFAGGQILGAETTALISWTTLSGLFSIVEVGFREIFLGLVLVILALREMHVIHLRLPEKRGQVPQGVFNGNIRRAAFRFGYELGTGVRTFLSSSAPYALLLTLVLIGESLWLAVITGLGFGAGRAMSLLTLPHSTSEKDEGPIHRAVSAASAVCLLALAFIVFGS